MKVVMRGISRGELSGTTLITGFRGFGMVGYMASKHLALALEARKIGYILVDLMPPFIAVEEDGLGYPFDIYYSDKAKSTIIVNRALPEREFIDYYTRSLARWASKIGFNYAILLGGLSRDFKPPNDPHGYRWLYNRHYKGPILEAPLLEIGLGVMGPLASLYMYLDYEKVPSIMILPYSMVEGVDYDASLLAVKIVSRKLLEVDVRLAELETLARTQKAEVERMISMIEREERESKGIFM
ncbi:MAG: PAC2 family protein [Acidilobaceae archaeon]